MKQFGDIFVPVCMPQRMINYLIKKIRFIKTEDKPQIERKYLRTCMLFKIYKALLKLNNKKIPPQKKQKETPDF